ncbi:MAG: hypothetical protein IJP59_12875 [Muribaculaceae bacterium]|nr:hypothetical protein [Muribaculaceae bacterium]
MKKILLAISSMLVMSIAFTSTFTSCKTEGNHADTLLDTTVIEPVAPAVDSALVDSSATATDVKSVTGKVVDGAMNSVFVEVEPGNSIEFSYSQLDRNDSEVFYNWSIDDEITINYVEVERGGELVDSVVSIQKAE